MANAYQTATIFTNEALRILQNTIVLGKQVSRAQEDQFGKESMKIGNTINIRRPAQFTVNTGAAFAAVDYTESSIPLVITSQKHVDTTFTSADLKLSVQDFSDRIIKPKSIRLAQQIDIDGYVSAKNTVANTGGTPGTTPNAVANLFTMGQILDNFSTPRDGQRNAAFDQVTTASLVGALTGFFNPTTQISSQYKEGLFSDTTGTVGLDIAMSQNVARHTVGPLGGAPVVNGASQSITAGWANSVSLVTNGWTAAAAPRVNAGDIFTIANVFSVNPVTKQSTGALQQFVVLGNQSSDAAGNLTIVASPAIISAGPFQNVTAAPANAAALTFAGTANTSYVRNLAWHHDAFALAVVPMLNLAEFGGWGAVKSMDGFSLRTFRQAAISTDTVGTRIDALYGWATPYPELALTYWGS